MQVALQRRHIDALLQDSIDFDQAVRYIVEEVAPQAPPTQQPSFLSRVGSGISDVGQRVVSAFSSLYDWLKSAELEALALRKMPEYEDRLEGINRQVEGLMDHMDRTLGHAGISVQGWDPESHMIPSVARNKLMRDLASGRVGGGESTLVKDTLNIALQAQALVQMILTDLRQNLARSPGARQAVGDEGPGFDEIADELLSGLDDIVANANAAVAAQKPLARMARSSDEEFDAAVDDIVAPMREVMLDSIAAVNEVQNLLSELREYVPEYTSGGRRPGVIPTSRRGALSMLAPFDVTMNRQRYMRRQAGDDLPPPPQMTPAQRRYRARHSGGQ
jgi:hypothetical protein